MKTLLFAPCYLDEGERLQRNLKWLEYYSKDIGLKFDEIILIDNGSSQEKKQILKNSGYKFTLIECPVHIPRLSANQYGYWYAAFGKAAKYAIDNNFDKIVHIDTDVFLLKPGIVNHVNEFKSGWQAFWSNIYNFPESTFQLISKDQFENVYEHMTRDFLAYYPDKIAEKELPFTHVEKSFIGDRYPEKGLNIQDSSWDYVGQTPVHMEVKFNE